MLFIVVHHQSPEVSMCEFFNLHHLPTWTNKTTNCDTRYPPQIREIISHLSRQRQNLFFSATWPREVQQLANEFLTDAVQINIGDSGVLNANKVDC